MESFAEMAVDPLLNASLDEMIKRRKESVAHKDIENFNHYIRMSALLNTIEREYLAERDEYKLNKPIVNLLTDLGFTIAPVESYAYGGTDQSKIQRLIKTTRKHMIVVNFSFKARIIEGPQEYQERWIKENPKLH